MTDLNSALCDYLTVRRALGYKLERAEKLLGQFLAYCHQAGAGRVTTELAVAWATLPTDAGPGWRAQRLTVVRRFAAWLQTLDPATEVPPTDVLGCATSRRVVPYLYTDADVVALMDATSRLRYPLQQATYRALVGLLAVSGMRVGEAIGLDRDDVGFDPGLVRVRRSKFGKSRELPLHQSAVDALRAYAKQRDKLCPEPGSQSFLLSSAGTRLIYCNVWSHFHTLARHAGLEPRSERCRPRLHDLRHAFAVGTLIGWYRAGVDVQSRMPMLSTYMGHVDPKSTYWYLSAAPELLALAARRLEHAEEERP